MYSICMKTEKQLKQRRGELEMLLNLITKYKVLVSIRARCSLKAQITNIDWLLDEGLAE